jgi:hypothetical protein
MAVSKSSLSAGEIICAILVNDAEVMARAKKVYPVVEDTAELPYLVYRRTSLKQDLVKGRRGADTVSIEVLCYTEHYTEGAELAEAVRDALDGRQYDGDDLAMRSCYLEDSEEAWQDDAYVQQLVFTIKI